MVAEYVLDIPMSIVSECSPNKRKHWAVLYRARGDMRVAARASLLDRYTRRYIQLHNPIIHIFAIGTRVWDRDNLIASLKAAFDELQSLGILENDRDLTIGCVLSITWPRRAWSDKYRRAQGSTVWLRVCERGA